MVRFQLYFLLNKLKYHLSNSSFVLIYSESKDPQVCLSKHRFRQTSFMSRCMRELKDRNKTWVLLIDVDEYISSDALDWGGNDPYDGMQLPSNAFPSFDKHETIHDILKSMREVEPCFTFTRQLYGAKEDYNHSIWIDMAPSGFDDTDFVTLKYRWRALKNKVFTNRWQKTIVDVSRIETEDLVKRPGMTVHLTVLPRYPGANHGAHCKKDPRKFRTTLLRAVSLEQCKIITLEFVPPLRCMFFSSRTITLIATNPIHTVRMLGLTKKKITW